MSFDRVLPSKISQVSFRHNSPVVAILIVSALLFIGLLGSTYYGVIFALLNATMMGTIGLATTALAGAVFPLTRKRLYEQSPISRYKPLGIPLVTILGVVSFFFFIYLALSVGLNPILGGTNDPWPLTLLLIFFIGFGLSYFVVRSYRKATQGKDISLTFKELPPD
jgi:amino acid transporter